MLRRVVWGSDDGAEADGPKRPSCGTVAGVVDGESWMAVSELLLCCGLEDLETVRELVGGAVKEGGMKR